MWRRKDDPSRCIEEQSTVAQECVWLFDVFQDFSGDDGVEPSAGKSLHHLAGIACHAFVVVVRKRAPIEVKADQIGRAHVCTPVTNAHLVCRLLLEKKKQTTNTTRQTHN